MNVDIMIDMLYNKDTSLAFENLKELELLSNNSNILYPYINQFIDMVSSEKYVIRVRGFRLLCKQSKWGIENLINNSINKVLIILNDEKPTAVRQALSALKDVVIYKGELCNIIKEKILNIDYLRYKDSMQGLIYKDIQNLMNIIESK